MPLAHLLLLLIPVPRPAQEPGELPRNPVSWDGLEARLEAEAKAGFAGSVLVLREGAIVLDKGYGLANREKEIANRPDTIFAIGSTPIDFTKASILLLAEAGELALADPLSFFFPEAPEDKRGITLDQLLSGRSGLVDFVDTPADRDPDHAWIDRDEFLRRVFGSALLFQPGQGREHSHAAFGVLAAVIEVVSGETYPEFTRKRLFEPAGMHDTGFFGAEIPAQRLALGYGPRQDGVLNAPPYWGPTSWLVMGSGGQVSTTHDLLRWHQALRAGKILGPELLPRAIEPPGALLNGGDMYGFEVYYTQGPGSQMFLCSNAAENRARRRAIEALAGDLLELVLRR